MMPELDCDFFTKHLYCLKGTETIYTGPYLKYDNYGSEGREKNSRTY